MSKNTELKRILINLEEFAEEVDIESNKMDDIKKAIQLLSDCGCYVRN